MEKCPNCNNEFTKSYCTIGVLSKSINDDNSELCNVRIRDFNSCKPLCLCIYDKIRK